MEGTAYDALGTQERPGTPLNKDIAFLIVLFGVLTTSGGVILGVGPFGAIMQEEGLIDSASIGIVFDGGFQIMTWMSVIWCIFNTRLGPRFCVILGMLIAAAGNAIICLAAASKSQNALVYMLGYGLIGGGGNAVLFSSFHFANLFSNMGFRCGLLSGAFNSAGVVYLLLNIDGVTARAFFGAYFVFQLLFAAVFAVIFPDVPYASAADRCVIAPPSLAHLRSGALCDFSDLHGVGSALREPKFWGFVLAFSWATLVNVWVGGALFAHHYPSLFFRWGYPILGNFTFLFSPAVGWLIDRTGFRVPGALLILVTQLCLGCLLLPDELPAVPWLAILCFNWIESFAYTLEVRVEPV